MRTTSLLFIALFIQSIISGIVCPHIYADTDLNYKLRDYIEYHKLYEEPVWLALLHYKRRVDGGYISEADGERFFISPSGKTDPESEMLYDINAFMRSEKDIPQDDMHPQCRFPARYKWLKSRLMELNIRFVDIKCPRFEEWSSLIRPRGMTLVYASGYLNNPASMFGHTFIRLDRKEKYTETDLLSYVVNYAANPTTTNALFYAILGLTGGFHGTFSTLPYYMKVREYGSMEHRDLWEYHLNVSDEQLDYVLRHIWELGSTYFNYYYIDENCSYHILSLIQVAYPEIDFREYFLVYTVPQDTIKFILKQKGLVKGVSYRPSLKSTLESMVKNLTDSELDMAIEIGKSKGRLNIPDGFYKLNDRSKVRVLDTAAVLFRFYNGYGLKEEEEREVARLEKEILLLRAKIDLISEKSEIWQPAPPHTSHGPAALGVKGGYSSKGFFEGISLKPVLHDLVSPGDGYEPLTQIDMLNLELRFNNTYEKVFVDRFDLIKIYSLVEMRRWLKKLSWNLNISFEADYTKDLENMKYLNLVLRGGPGVTFGSKIINQETYFAFWESEGGIDRDFSLYLNSGFLSGIIFNVSGKIDLILQDRIYYEFYGQRGLENEFSSILAYHLIKDRDIRIGSKLDRNGYYEYSIVFFVFF